MPESPLTKLTRYLATSLQRNLWRAWAVSQEAELFLSSWLAAWWNSIRILYWAWTKDYPQNVRPSGGEDYRGPFTSSERVIIRPITRPAIRKIAAACEICKHPAQVPERVNLTVDTNEIRFKSVVKVHTMFLNNRAVLYITYMYSHFCTATLPLSPSMRCICKCLLSQWILASMGHPNI